MAASRIDRTIWQLILLICVSALFWYLPGSTFKNDSASFVMSECAQLPLDNGSTGYPEVVLPVQSEPETSLPLLNLPNTAEHTFSSLPVADTEPMAGPWADVPEPDRTEQDPAHNTWLWIQRKNEEASSSKQRSSWGGLRQQGTQALISDALLEDKKYVFTDGIWGFNNQVIQMMNVIYLGYLSNRIPILFGFNEVSGHFKGHQWWRTPASTVYDLSSLAGTLDMPLIDAHEVKMVERMPEWQRPIIYDGEFPQEDENGVPLEIGAEIFPKVPSKEEIAVYSYSLAAHKPQGWNNPMVETNVNKLALLSDTCYEGDCERATMFDLVDVLGMDPQDLLPDHRALGLDDPAVMPNGQVAYIDNMFYHMTHPSRFRLIVNEIEEGYGMWAIVGKHMRFQPGLTELAKVYLRGQMGLTVNAEVPPYVAVHIRRGDMMRHRPQYAQKSAREYLYETWLLLEEIRQHKGLDITDVVVATDEKDSEWLAPLREAGWHLLNHTATDTAVRLGSEWFPVLIDSVILSGGHGFLGMHDSTMSGLAMRRVIDWQNGLGRFAQASRRVPNGWQWSWPSRT